MFQCKTTIDLFGEIVELRTSALMNEAIPISCFLTTGDAITDVGLIRPFDGLVQYDDTRMLAAIENVRQRQSTGYRLFFLIAQPILILFDLAFALLRGIGRFFSAISIFGIFSLVFGLMIMAAMIATLGTMAMVFIYALPLLILVYVVRSSYQSGNREAVLRMKDACRRLADRLASGQGSDEEPYPAPEEGIVIDATAQAAPAPAAMPPLPAPELTPAVEKPKAKEGQGLASQLAKGLAIGLILGIPGVAAVVYTPKALEAARTQSTPAKQSVASLPTIPIRPAPAAREPTIHSGSAEAVNTATLTVNGKPIVLAGLVAVERPEASAAAQAYLTQAGPLRCEEAPMGGWRCVVVAKGLDVAEVFALSGLAKAAADAPDFLRNAEAMARESRRGIWGAS